MKVFLVKDLDTGLYSTGGFYPGWVGPEKAKRYRMKNHASSHIRMCCGDGEHVRGPYSQYYRAHAQFRADHPNLAIVECVVKIEEGTITPYVYD